MKQIVLQPKNPNDIKPEELEGFAGAIRSAYPEYNIRVEAGEGYKGYAVTFYEVLTVWILSSISKQLLDRITALAVDWARERFIDKPRRPKSITIYDAKGNPLKSITLKNPTDNPEINIISGKQYRIKPTYKKRRFWIF